MRLGFAAFLFAALTRTVSDADLWGHILFGRDIVKLGAIPTRDIYSFTSDVTWINHEWLAEVIAYVGYAGGDTAGLVAIKSLVLLVMLAAVLAALRPVSSDPVVHDLLVFLAVAGTYGRAVTFRPQVFSLMLFPALLLTLTTAERGRPKALLAVPVIFLVWANLHGGWIVGLGAFGLWVSWTLVYAKEYRISRGWLVGIAAASLAATLGTPYGIDLWRFLAATVRVSRRIADWQPLWNLPAITMIPWLTATALAGWTMVAERRHINPSHMAIVGMCWVGSIRVSRLDAFFVLSAVILLGPHIQPAFRRVVRPSGADMIERRTGLGGIAAAALLIGLIGMAVSRNHFQCIEIPDNGAPEPEAVTFAKTNRLRGRMFTFFDWGEYAIWHLAPDLQVSIDGRRETVYSEEMTAAHLNVYGDGAGALDFVEGLQPDYVWLPERFSILKKLEAKGWVRIFRGSRSTILARAGEGSSVRAAPPAQGSRCFPGP